MKRGRLLLLIAALSFSAPAWAMTACARWLALGALAVSLAQSPHAPPSPPAPAPVLSGDDRMALLVTDYEAAAVHWTTYDDREDFREAPQMMHDYFTVRGISARETSFTAAHNRPGVAEDNVFQVPVKADLKSGPDSFAATVERALERLVHAFSPRLYVAVGGHGGTYHLARQYGDPVAYYDLLGVLDEKVAAFVRKTGRTPEIYLYADACRSGTTIAIARHYFTDPNGAYENGTKERFRLPVTVIAASRDDESAYGNELFSDLRNSSAYRSYLYTHPPQRFRLDVATALDARRRSTAELSYWSSNDPQFGPQMALLAQNDLDKLTESGALSSARLGIAWRAVSNEKLLALLEKSPRDFPARGVLLEFKDRNLRNPPDRKTLLEWAGSAESPHVRLFAWQLLLTNGNPEDKEPAFQALKAAAFPELPLEDPWHAFLRGCALEYLESADRDQIGRILPELLAEYRAERNRIGTVVFRREHMPGEERWVRERLGSLRRLLGRLNDTINTLLDTEPQLARKPERLAAFIGLGPKEELALAKTTLTSPASYRRFLLSRVSGLSSPAIEEVLAAGNAPETSVAELRDIARVPTDDFLKLSMVRKDDVAPVVTLFLRLPIGDRKVEFEALFPTRASIAINRQRSRETLEALLKVPGWTPEEKSELERRLRQAESADADRAQK